jgi:hypothetical protein
MSRLRAVALALALAPVVALAADADLVKLFGKTKTIAKGGAVFEVRDPRGTYGVSAGEDVAVVLGKATALKDFKGFTQIHILGYKTPSSKPELALVNEIRAMVAADEFKPPPVPLDLEKKKIAWHSGAFDSRDGVYHIGSHRIEAPGERKVAVLTVAKLDALSADKLVYVEATPIGEKKTSKQVTAKKIVVCGDGVPAGEWKLILAP